MKSRSLLIPAGILIVALVLLFVIAGRWNTWQATSLSPKTDDAYVHANIVSLSTKVSGTLRELKVNDFQSVHAGQVLAVIDDRDYSAKVQQAEASLSGSEANLAENQAQKEVQDAKIASAQSAVAEAIAGEDAARAAVSAAEPDVVRTEQERHRQELLFAQNATLRRRYLRLISISAFCAAARPISPKRRLQLPGLVAHFPQASGIGWL